VAEKIDYQRSYDINIDKQGRPIVRLAAFSQLHGAGRHDFFNVVVDSGASVTTLKKRTAANNEYKIIKPRAIILFGVNDQGIITRNLSAKGISTEEIISANLHKDASETKQFLIDNGLPDVGLVYDLRVIPLVVLCGYKIESMIVATPSEDNTDITEVLGMNVLGRFEFGVSLEKKLIYLSENTGAYIPPNPNYMCGDISLEQTSHLSGADGK
jgi:hypothetical protein